MSSFVPAFPAPAPSTLPISAEDQDDLDRELNLPDPTEEQSPGHQTITVLPVGRENDEELETLSIHERLVDEAHARSPETARVPVEEPASLEPEPDPEVDFLQTEHGRILQERLSVLVAAFRDRSQKAKQIIMQPPPPDRPKPEAPPPPPISEDSAIKAPTANATKEKKLEAKKKAEESKKPPLGLPKSVPPPPPPPVIIPIWKQYHLTVPELFFAIPRPRAFDPHSRKYLVWLFFVSLAFVYNAIAIPYRSAFEDHQDEYFYIWLIVDYICDAIYLVDLIIWKPSIRTYINGIEELNKKEITRKYVQGDEFKLDVLCLLPLDFFYLVDGVGINPLLRLPRLLKVLGYWEFLDRIDQVASNPYNYYFRVLRSFSYMMYLIHANACIYYYFSYWYDFDPMDPFVYNNNRPECQNETTRAHYKCTFPGQYNDYIFCFFFSVSMVTIIGNFNFPGLVSEMLYSTVLWFVGVFIFATIVGQIRDVLKAMTRHEDDFYEVMDAIVEHMHTLKIPKELQDRVRAWLLFNWEQQKTIDERHLLDGLPTKLRSDLAMEVHFTIIHKVALFKDVDNKVLEELLLRLRPTVYLPMDSVCKRGEIGKEMYIVKSGMLEVVLPDGRVAVTLGPGSVFGEISLLSLAGGNRRTADVRSKGFTNLYTLSKADLNDVMKDYPETFTALKEKAHELMNKGKPVTERPPTPPPVEVIPTRPPTPEMVRVALSILKHDSAIRRRMSQSAGELTSYNTPEKDLSEDEDVEIALATDNLEGKDLRVATPEPIPDVTAEMVEHRLAGDELNPHQANEARELKSAGGIRRRRSQVNEPGNLSSSESEDGNLGGSRRGSSAAGRLRRKRNARQSKSPAPSPLPIDQLQAEQLQRARSPKPVSSLISLKRRLFSAPKVHPIGGDGDSVTEPEAVSAANRPGVFSFERKTSLEVDRIPLPKASTASFSDYEFGTNLSDTFAGVTFSSDTETP